MSLWRQLSRGLRALVHRSATDRDIADEVEQYVDDAAAAFEASGLAPEDARRAARRQLGSVTAVHEQVRAYGWEHIVETTLSDIRHAARRIRRYPSHATVAALTLALGIGASTAIFSAVNPVLFQPLPYPVAKAGREGDSPRTPSNQTRNEALSTIGDLSKLSMCCRPWRRRRFRALKRGATS